MTEEEREKEESFDFWMTLLVPFLFIVLVLGLIFMYLARDLILV